jgi:hypothetical protein
VVPPFFTTGADAPGSLHSLTGADRRGLARPDDPGQFFARGSGADFGTAGPSPSTHGDSLWSHRKAYLSPSQPVQRDLNTNNVFCQSGLVLRQLTVTRHRASSPPIPQRAQLDGVSSLPSKQQKATRPEWSRWPSVPSEARAAPMTLGRWVGRWRTGTEAGRCYRQRLRPRSVAARPRRCWCPVEHPGPG